mgnify:CR=1 FL=1
MRGPQHASLTTAFGRSDQTPAELEAQGAAAGFRVLPRLEVPENDEYLGATVVMLGG